MALELWIDETSCEPTLALIRKGRWSEAEDAQLLQIRQQHPDYTWVQIAKVIKTRTASQLRYRYTSHLDPEINKGPFTASEDAALVRLSAQWGSSWADIAKHMPGRTENSVKSRIKTLAREQKPKRRKSAPGILLTTFCGCRCSGDISDSSLFEQTSDILLATSLQQNVLAVQPQQVFSESADTFTGTSSLNTPQGYDTQRTRVLMSPWPSAFDKGLSAGSAAKLCRAEAYTVPCSRRPPVVATGFYNTTAAENTPTDLLNSSSQATGMSATT